MKTKLTTDQIRTTIKEAQRSLNCRATDLTQNEIKKRLPTTTSHGTSGPMISEMLEEACLSEMLRFEEIPDRLKAAYFKTMRDNIDLATSRLKDKLSAEVRKNDELSFQLIKTNEETEALRQELLTLRSSSATEIAALNTNLAQTQGQLDSLTEIKADYMARTEEALKQVEERKNELVDLKETLSAALKNEARATESCRSQTELISTIEARLHEAQRDKDLAEQKGRLLEDHLAEQKKEVQRLQTQGEKQVATIDQLREKLLIASERKADIAARLDERSKPIPETHKRTRNSEKTK